MRFTTLSTVDSGVRIFKDRQEVWNISFLAQLEGENARLRMSLNENDRITFFKNAKGRPKEEVEQLKRELAETYTKAAQVLPSLILGRESAERKLHILQCSSEQEKTCISSMLDDLNDMFKDTDNVDTVKSFSTLMSKILNRVNDSHQRLNEGVVLSGPVFQEEIDKILIRFFPLLVLLVNDGKTLRKEIEELKELTQEKALPANQEDDIENDNDIHRKQGVEVNASLDEDSNPSESVSYEDDEDDDEEKKKKREQKQNKR